MPEASITTYSKEAQRLYQRGVAAARGGQRRIAAGLLTKAVQLDPRHEQAWLWLSGVLDDPQEVEFCLRAALKLNPTNQQARKGLAWIQKRRAEVNTQRFTPAATSSRLQSIKIPDADQPPPKQVELSWWQEWRRSIVWQRKVRIVTLAVLMILIIGSTLLLNTVEQQALAPLPQVPTAAPQSFTAQQQVQSSAPQTTQAAILDYMSSIAGLRSQLDTAAQTYQATSNTSTVTAEQIDAARVYRDQLRAALSTWGTITPPDPLQSLHAEYLQGLELEHAALEDVLEYYTNYNIAIANRAALRLQEANGHYERARLGWQVYQEQLHAPLLGDPYELR